VWLKKNGFRADQVQAFLPSPMATATAMWHSGKNPLKRVTRSSEEVIIPKGIKVRRLHKAFLRYHDPENWPILREALKRMGRADLIGNGQHHLIPAYQPVGTRAGGGIPRMGGVPRASLGGSEPRSAGGPRQARTPRPSAVPRTNGAARANGAPQPGTRAGTAGIPFRTQHTGLPKSGTASKSLRPSATSAPKRRGR